MNKVRERIRGYITSGILKTQGIKKLKKEFKMNESILMSMWLEERLKLQPPPRKCAIASSDEIILLKIRVKKKDVKNIVEYVKTL